MDPAGKFVYVVNELTSTVTVFSYESGSGTLKKQQTVSTRPKDAVVKNTTAEIVVDSRGRFLYVSNRGDDSIVVFSIDESNGNLTPVQWISSGGKSPRHITIDPTGQWMFASNQRSDVVTLFQIDGNTGKLTPTSHSLKVVSPVCVIAVPIE